MIIPSLKFHPLWNGENDRRRNNISIEKQIHLQVQQRKSEIGATGKEKHKTKQISL
jgi:hypothetical protein